MTYQAENEGVLSRWSRRKLDKQANSESNELEETRDETSEETSVDVSSVEPQIEHIEQGEPEATVPLWLQADVDPDIKQSALSALFRQPEFKAVDRMNEYDEDFTQFKGLGTIITQEMKRMLKLAEEKTRSDEPREPLAETNLNTIDNTTRLSELTTDISEPPPNNEDDEDNEIA